MSSGSTDGSAASASGLRRWRPVAALLDLGALGPVAAFTVAGPAVGAALLVATSTTWFEPLRASGAAAGPWLVVATIVLAGLSLVPTHATSLVAGILFGAVEGSLLAMGGIAGAALLGYGVLRPLAGERALAWLSVRPRAAAVHRAVVDRQGHEVAGLIALVRLSPAMPFAGTNLLMAAAGVGVPAFLGGTLLGIAPRVIAVAVAGAGLEELDLSRGGDRGLAVLGLVGTLLALAVMSRIARRALRDMT